MIHHVFRGIHHTARHSHRVLNHIGGYYFRNPNKILDHDSTVAGIAGSVGKTVGHATIKHGPKLVKAGGHVAVKGGVHISKMVWTHGPTVAKYSAKFMAKSALNGLKLLSS